VPHSQASDMPVRMDARAAHARAQAGHCASSARASPRARAPEAAVAAAGWSWRRMRGTARRCGRSGTRTRTASRWTVQGPCASHDELHLVMPEPVHTSQLPE